MCVQEAGKRAANGIKIKREKEKNKVSTDTNNQRRDLIEAVDECM